MFINGINPGHRINLVRLFFAFSVSCSCPIFRQKTSSNDFFFSFIPYTLRVVGIPNHVGFNTMIWEEFEKEAGVIFFLRMYPNISVS